MSAPVGSSSELWSGPPWITAVYVGALTDGLSSVGTDLIWTAIAVADAGLTILPWNLTIGVGSIG